MKSALILPAQYHDSVVLMRIAATVKSLPDVVEAALFMGSAANHEILAAADMDTPETALAGPDDLIIVVKGQNRAAADQGLEKARELLSAKAARDTNSGESRARTIDGAYGLMPDANLACFSIPGQYVGYEAGKALEKGLNLFIFSDNVPLDQELALKREALRRELLCMGPDCGTAYVNGVGMGFFNALPQGRVGYVASSGTGLQALSCALAAHGEGISHGIGVGGRDLSPEIGGLMTVAALQALDRDDRTQVIVLIAKEPSPQVLPVLEKCISGLQKPCVICCLGFSGTIGGRATAANLDEALTQTLNALGRGHGPGSPEDAALRASLAPARQLLDGRNTRLLGLYTGGTLAHEAHLELLGCGVRAGYGPEESGSCRILDLGDDVYTRGRPHPMIDPTQRNEIVAESAVRDEAVVLLFDLVLGRGAHPDPARGLADALAQARDTAAAGGGAVIALGSIVGTAEDYQNMAAQRQELERAGAILFPTNRQAARAAAMLLGAL